MPLSDAAAVGERVCPEGERAGTGGHRHVRSRAAEHAVQSGRLELGLLHIASTARPYFRTHGVGWLWALSGVLAVAIELPHGLGRRPEAARRDRGSRVVIVLCLAVGIIVAARGPELAPGATIRPPLVAFVVGELVFLSGCGLRLWAIRTLGRYFTRTVMVSSDQQVVTSGPYAIVRHPSYTALLMYAIGVGLIWGNWISFVAILLATLIALAYRIRVEEQALRSTLGDAYRSYASQHKRLIPLIW